MQTIELKIWIRRLRVPIVASVNHIDSHSTPRQLEGIAVAYAPYIICDAGRPGLGITRLRVKRDQVSF